MDTNKLYINILEYAATGRISRIEAHQEARWIKNHHADTWDEALSINIRRFKHELGSDPDRRTMTTMNIGKAIRVVRTARGMTQSELSKEINMVDSSISLIENGYRRTSIDTIATIADALDIPLVLLVVLAMDKEDAEGMPPGLMQQLGHAAMERICS